MSKPNGYNAPANLKRRRQAALERREKDVAKLETASKAGTPVGKKLDIAKQDVVNLYAKLGLKKD